MAANIFDTAYKLKKIRYHERDVSIIVQNENGPCPLIAIANVLLLREEISVHGDMAEVALSELLELLVDRALAVHSRITHRDAEYAANAQQALADAIHLLPQLARGMDVNVRFTSIDDFEFTPECAIFDLLNIQLVHGWLIDDQDKALSRAVGRLSYNQLVEKVVAATSSATASIAPRDDRITSADGARSQGEPLVPETAAAGPAADLLTGDSYAMGAVPAGVVSGASTGGLAGVDQPRGSTPSPCHEVGMIGDVPLLIGAPTLTGGTSGRDGHAGALVALMDTTVEAPAQAGEGALLAAAAARSVSDLSEEEMLERARLLSLMPQEEEGPGPAQDPCPPRAQPTGGAEQGQVPGVGQGAGEVHGELERWHGHGGYKQCTETAQGGEPPRLEPRLAPGTLQDLRLVAVRCTVSDLGAVRVSVRPVPGGPRGGAGAVFGNEGGGLDPICEATGEIPAAAPVLAGWALEPSGPVQDAGGMARESEGQVTAVSMSPYPSPLIGLGSDNSSGSPAAVAPGVMAKPAVPSAPAEKVASAVPVTEKGAVRSSAEARDAMLIDDFLHATASQLTVYGLYRLHADLKEGHPCVLFRNCHFSTLLKHNKHLYLLVTDQGYLDEDVVWERLSQVDGDTQLMRADFEVFQGQTATGHGASSARGASNAPLAADAARAAALLSEAAREGQSHHLQQRQQQQQQQQRQQRQQQQQKQQQMQLQQQEQQPWQQQQQQQQPHQGASPQGYEHHPQQQLPAQWAGPVANQGVPPGHARATAAVTSGLPVPADSMGHQNHEDYDYALALQLQQHEELEWQRQEAARHAAAARAAGTVHVDAPPVTARQAMPADSAARGGLAGQTQAQVGCMVRLASVGACTRRSQAGGLAVVDILTFGCQC
eukprot:jgi/Mesvir1/22870/Mv20114-RA.3